MSGIELDFPSCSTSLWIFAPDVLADYAMCQICLRLGLQGLP